MIVAFDFDNTLTREDARGRFVGWRLRGLNRLRRHALTGDLVLIVTARQDIEEDRRLSAEGRRWLAGYPLVHASVDRFRLPVEGIVFTDRKLKGPTLAELEVALLYDDLPEQRASAIEHGITAVDLS